MCYIKSPFDPYEVYKNIPWQPTPQPQTGWVCPKCGKVHAPWVGSCDCTFPKYEVTCGVNKSVGVE